MIKKNLIKPVSILLCGALLVGGVGATVHATGVNNTAPAEAAQAAPTTSVKETQSEVKKDETVYVLAGADGSVEKIIVSDWIKNTLGSTTLSDESGLSDVEAVNEDESYTMNSDNMRVWDAKGNDVYYQGNIALEVPVTLSVSYKLDGKSISPSDLAGQSGKVTIRFDYTNHQYETVEIDGTEEEIYVPFAMLSGMILDNDSFTNVEVSNGKLINDGDRTIVAGIAFPGLQDNLAVDSDQLEIPDYVEITADVTAFEMSNTITVATNEVFNDIDTDELDSMDDLKDSLHELTDAMEQLMDGSSQLYDGLCTLLDKSGELINGIDQLADGADQLRTGAGALSSGASDLADGASALASGLNELEANSDSLNAGSKQVFDSLLSMADTQLAAAGLSVPKLTIENYAETLNGVIASLDETNVAEQARAAALEAVTDQVYASRDTITAAVTAAVQEEISQKVSSAIYSNVETQVLATMGLTRESYESGIADGTISAEQQAQIQAAVDNQMNSDAVKAMLSQQVTAQLQTEEIQALITAKTEEQIPVLIEQNMNSAEVQGKITAALEQAKSGAASVSALKQQLDSYYTFYTGLNQYTAGVASARSGADALNAGAGQLKAGSAELNAGANDLYNGILTLKNGTPALTKGVTDLRDGAMSLSDGLKQFNEEGIQKLVDAVDGDLGSLITRIKATADVSKNYNSFSGISEDMEGQVKFIYRTDSITTE